MSRVERCRLRRDLPEGGVRYHGDGEGMDLGERLLLKGVIV